MARGKFEGSVLDKRLDRAGAKRAGVSLKKFEGSAADRRMDKSRGKKK